MEKEKVSSERLMGMQAGNAELQSRLLDLIRGGLVEIDTATPQYLEEFAARMVDAQLGSIAKRIRLCATLRENFPDSWHERFLDEMGSLYLFSKAFQKFEHLPNDFQDELLAQAGVTTRAVDLFQKDGLQDDWLVLGQVINPEPNNLTSRRTWLMGKNCQKIVLSLEYAFGTNEFTTQWLKGMAYTGEPVFYPASYPLRVAFKSVDLAPHFSEISGYLFFDDFLKKYSEALTKNPWLPQFPVLMTQVIPVFLKNNFSLIDKEKKSIPIGEYQLSLWELLALSGGHPISVFGEWDGKIFTPLNAFQTVKQKKPSTLTG